MTHIKKMMTAMLVAVMALALGSALAFAADGYTITINKNGTDKAAHTYGAYQIFQGDLASVDGKDILSNVTWGEGVNGAAIITELKKTDAFSSLANNASAADVAKAIADQQYTTDSAGAQAIADAISKGLPSNPKGTADIAADETSGTIANLPAGYYLVQDTADVSAYGAKTRYILEVVKSVTVNEKASVPSVDKKIAEATPTNVSDYSIGDSIPYTITGTLPSDFGAYKTYKTFTFEDTMSNGLTPPAAADVTVKIGNDTITDLFDVTVSGQKLTVKLKDNVDLKTAKHGTGDGTAFAAGDSIVVSYSATLNNNAVIGGTGNINTVTLEFSNNPNSDSDGDKGKTPEDQTVVFTYTIKADKVKATSDAAITADAYNALSATEKAQYVKVGDKYQKVEALSGAGFTLYKDDGKGGWTQVGEEVTGVTTFEFKGQDAGKYKLVETTVPSGYNKAADVEITVAATYTNDKPAKIATLIVTPETAGFTADKASGVVSGKILNQQGSTLPSTGGMGTTIIYVIGGIMVLLAGVYLITKRRASKESDL